MRVLTRPAGRCSAGCHDAPIAPVDHRAQRSPLDQLPHDPERFAHLDRHAEDERLVAEEPRPAVAEIEAHHAAPGHEVAAVVGEDAPGARKRALAEGVEDDVVGVLARRDVFLRVVDHVPGAERGHECPVRTAANAGDLRAEVPRHLHGRGADASRRAKDQHAVATLDARPIPEEVERRRGAVHERCCLIVGETAGDEGEGAVLRRAAELGVGAGAEPREAEHTIPDPKAVTAEPT